MTIWQTLVVLLSLMLIAVGFRAGQRRGQLVRQHKRFVKIRHAATVACSHLPLGDAGKEARNHLSMIAWWAESGEEDE